jgi:hypothetical protein
MTLFYSEEKPHQNEKQTKTNKKTHNPSINASQFRRPARTPPLTKILAQFSPNPRELPHEFSPQLRELTFISQVMAVPHEKITFVWR